MNDKKLEVKSSADGDVSAGETTMLSKDEQHLAKLGYKQEFFRHLGLFESWAATYITMNFVSGLPVLFGFAMYTGGPKAAFANWTMVGGLSFFVSLSLAEIAAAFPTAGSIYFWSYRLGGKRHGRLLSWMTAWWNWVGWICVVPGVQQGATNFLLSALEVKYPGSSVVRQGWFSWLVTTLGLVLAMLPNIISPMVLKLYFRFAMLIFFVLFACFWIWFPIKAAGKFQSGSEVFNKFYNGINLGPEKQASDAYAWMVGILFGAWDFYGYDASAHLAEETHDASDHVATGMWAGTLCAWLMSVPVSDRTTNPHCSSKARPADPPITTKMLIMILFCMQDFDGIVSATYPNNWAEYLVQLVGPEGAVALLVLLWLDSTCATASCFMSAQRVTFAISRDGVLPFSRYFRRLSGSRIPVHAAFLVFVLGVAITCAVIGSTVAFTAITATATIVTNVSYLIPIVARHTIGKRDFQPARFNLGRYSTFVGAVSAIYIMFIFVVLVLPQLYPVTAQTLNYAPICIAIVTIISLVGWILPFGLGGRHWFEGPKRTIDDDSSGGGEPLRER